MANKIVFIVGMTGSGKSVVSDELVRQGFSFVRFGQIVLDKVKEEGLEVNEVNERKIREGLRKQYGMAAMALLNIPKFDELLKKFNVVGDGLYSWAEYKILKEKYGNLMYVIAVYAPPELRYQRLEKRRAKKNDSANRFRPTTKEESRSRDFSEIENLDKGGPIAMSNFTIINTGAINDLKQKTREILKKLGLLKN